MSAAHALSEDRLLAEVRALGGYLDDEVHAFLGVDGVLESVQNLMVVGLGDG